MKADAPLLETRSSLIHRLKATINGESWEDFFNTYWELIFNVARRAGLSHADAQDIVQETIVKEWKGTVVFKPIPSRVYLPNTLPRPVVKTPTLQPPATRPVMLTGS